MQRIKLEVFKTFFQKNLTGNEIDFLIALSRIQNPQGKAYGVHYREMIQSVKMSVQAFYDCKSSLEKKGMIEVKKGKDDYDITFCGNDFTKYTEEDYKRGTVKYLSTNHPIFSDRNWKKLKPKQKLLAMDLLNINLAGNFRAHKIGRKKFFSKYADHMENGKIVKGILEISVRTLQKYLQMLKLYFQIRLEDGMYHIYLRRPFAKRETAFEKQEEIERTVQTMCRRTGIKEADPKEAGDICNVIAVYQKEYLSSGIDLTTIFSEMLEILNGNVAAKRRWKKRLKASLFHKIFREKLGIVTA